MSSTLSDSMQADTQSANIQQPSEPGPTAPRPAAKRHKIALACEECRSRKVKCDGVRPHCSTCRRRSRGPVTCTYAKELPKPSSDRQMLHALYERVRYLENALAGAKQSTSGDVEAQTQVQNNMVVTGSPPLHNGRQSLRNATSNDATSVSRSMTDTRATPFHNESPHDAAEGEADDEEEAVSVDDELLINAMGVAASPQQGTSQGEEPYFGTTSAVAFFTQVQRAARTMTGRTSRSDTNKSASTTKQPQHYGSTLGSLFSRSSSNAGLPKMFRDNDMPTRAVADRLVEHYRSRVHCLYPFVHWPSFSMAYNQLWNGSDQAFVSRRMTDGGGLGSADCPTSTFYCGLSAVFALGGQFIHDLSKNQRDIFDNMFERCIRIIQLSALDRGNLALVQTLLLMAQYLQSTGLPSRCWNILGTACRIAQGLGLHLEENETQRSQLATEMRRRAWHGCVGMDTFISMTLGRPSGRHPSISTVPLPTDIDDECIGLSAGQDPQPSTGVSRTAFFIQTVKLYSTLGEILANIYDPWHASPASTTASDRPELFANGELVFRLDRELRIFQAELPPILDWTKPQQLESPGDSDNIISRQRNVLHARFLHVRVLLCRPMLLYFCQLEGPSAGSSLMVGQGLYSSFTQQCALDCVQTAQELVTLIASTWDTPETGAWWYNLYYVYHSTMVLTLAGLCPTLLSLNVDGALSRSLSQCQDILWRMADVSPNARKCYQEVHDILQTITAAAHDTWIGSASTDAFTFGSLQNAQPTNDVTEPLFNMMLNTYPGTQTVGDENFAMGDMYFTGNYPDVDMDAWPAPMVSNNE